jgi:hypothetical protein
MYEFQEVQITSFCRDFYFSFHIFWQTFSAENPTILRHITVSTFPSNFLTVARGQTFGYPSTLLTTVSHTGGYATHPIPFTCAAARSNWRSTDQHRAIQILGFPVLLQSLGVCKLKCTDDKSRLSCVLEIPRCFSETYKSNLIVFGTLPTIH